MAQTAVTADVHQALDVALDLAAQIAFDAQRELVDGVAQLLLVVFGQRFDASVRIDAGAFEDAASGRGTDAVDVG